MASVVSGGLFSSPVGRRSSGWGDRLTRTLVKDWNWGRIGWPPSLWRGPLSGVFGWNLEPRRVRPREGVCLAADMLTIDCCAISPSGSIQRAEEIQDWFEVLRPCVLNYIQMKSTKSGLFPLFLRVLHPYLFQCDLQLVLHLLHFCFLI